MTLSKQTRSLLRRTRFPLKKPLKIFNILKLFIDQEDLNTPLACNLLQISSTIPRANLSFMWRCTAMKTRNENHNFAIYIGLWVFFNHRFFDEFAHANSFFLSDHGKVNFIIPGGLKMWNFFQGVIL